MQKTNLMVIFGGASSEHDVSRVSAFSVLQMLNKEQYNIIKVGITKKGQWLLTKAENEKIKSGDWENEPSNKIASLSPDASIKGLIVLSGQEYEILPIDVVFPVMHGINGEDGTIQGLFELAQIPYVGCGVASSANCMDKALTKIVLDNANVLQAKWLLLSAYDFKADKETTINLVEKTFSYPVFIKPSSTGSSVGISKAKNRDELIAAINEASKYGEKIIVEEFIEGAEIEVAVLGNREPIASVCGEIAPARDFYDYEAKYNDDNSLLFIPARLEEKIANTVREIALKSYQALDCMGLSRVDFFVSKDNRIILNEINTIPGFTSISMYPKLFEATGIGYEELLNRLICLAFERKI